MMIKNTAPVWIFMTDWLLTETEIKNVHNHFNTRIKRLNFINLKGLSSVFSPQRRQDSSRIKVFFFLISDLFKTWLIFTSICLNNYAEIQDSDISK